MSVYLDGSAAFQSKAGLENIDNAKKAVESLTVGSKFQLHQQRAEARIQERIDELHAKYHDLAAPTLEDQLLLDSKLNAWELQRDLSQTWLHVDMDAFYVEVELLSRPELREMPVAVGDLDMLVTANYVARRFGIRSGLPGFVAVELCPSLVILPRDMSKYRQFAARLGKIFQVYDPNFLPISLDEASMNITKYLERFPSMDCQQVLRNLRGEILETLSLTCSIGCAPTRMIAKLASERNKPAGEFIVPAKRQEDFIQALPVRKIPGIGEVTDRLLESVGVRLVKDLLTSRDFLSKLFPQAEFFFKVALGLAMMKETKKKAASLSRLDTCSLIFFRSQTLKDFLSPEQLRENLSEFVESLLSSLPADQGISRITVKVKTIDFEAHTNSKVLEGVSLDLPVIACELLEPLLSTRIRMLGVILSLTDLKKQE